MPLGMQQVGRHTKYVEASPCLVGVLVGQLEQHLGLVDLNLVSTTVGKTVGGPKVQWQTWDAASK